MIDLDSRWDRDKYQNQSILIDELVKMADVEVSERRLIVDTAASLVKRIREEARPGMMEVFLAEYGLSSEEGVALMCLAEAMLRVPDTDTMDALIEDKIAPSDWSRHLGHSSSPLVNASTWGLMLTGKMLDDTSPGVAGTLKILLKRLGEPVVRAAVGGAMKEMGRQFVLGETIDNAIKRATRKETQGFTYSYDMLGEAAMTMADARRYQQAYSEAIKTISNACVCADVADNPGISVKLSALHPRYEVSQTTRVMHELVPVVIKLARQAASAGMGFNIDAEEADRLTLSLKVIEAVLADQALQGWDGFGVVVQAYGRRTSEVIDGLYGMALRLDRRLMVRLVKGAYWDTEIKHAQVEGLTDFSVFTLKSATDVSYLANARKLLSLSDRIYPQFATHNAHTVAAVLHMATNMDKSTYEFQRLHGMGEALHDLVHKDHGTRCRIYAPVGAHRDLLAYLVRRLLENGANSSFVNQLVDESVPPEEVVACPFDRLQAQIAEDSSRIPAGSELFLPDRKNSLGYDLNSVIELQKIADSRRVSVAWEVQPILAGECEGGNTFAIHNPASATVIGQVTSASPADVNLALTNACVWDASIQHRAEVLRNTADLFQKHRGELFALVALEAGKTLPDAVAELREAVDFLNYYASEATRISDTPRGVFCCISPWNFPLAIFTGQIAAALATGNAVVAKPAETTSAIAAWAVRLMHQAGIPREALQLLPGEGSVIGPLLTGDSRINGVAFTGSTNTARRIQRAMAKHTDPGTPLIAETGGLNAMIVDSTALAEQAVRDIIASAFQSAGQRCSALRCLYVQEDIADQITEMLIGAMDELSIGDPWQISTDVGPVITKQAQDDIAQYVDRAIAAGQLIYQLETPATGTFIAPVLLRVNGIEDLQNEVFGPVLHLARFRSGEMDRVIEDINARGYGLTFGLHTRIDERVQTLSDLMCVGNLYANRNQIGAIVGSQPFGGEGLSGTGPKAGGPNYLHRFTKSSIATYKQHDSHNAVLNTLNQQLQTMATSKRSNTSQVLPGPTGELNRLSTVARLPVLCLGPGDKARRQQKQAVESLGGIAVEVDGFLNPTELVDLSNFSALIWWGDEDLGRRYAKALCDLQGPIIPLITGQPDLAHVCHERHLCVDTTAAGGNTSLLAGQS